MTPGLEERNVGVVKTKIKYMNPERKTMADEVSGSIIPYTCVYIGECDAFKKYLILSLFFL